MESRDLTVSAGDGYELAATLYLSAADPTSGAVASAQGASEPGGSAGIRSEAELESDGAGGERRRHCVVVVASAMAVPRGSYDAFAHYLARRGFTVVTFDYRGTGGSVPERLRGCNATLADWGSRDLAGVLRWAGEELAADRLALVGHSVGGQLVGLLPQVSRLDALVTIAAQSGYWGHWSGAGRAGMWLLWHLVIPLSCRLLGVFPARLLGMGSASLPAGVARQWARWGRRRHYLLEARPEARAFCEYRGPVLGLSLDDDRYAPRPAVEALLSWFENAAVDHRHLAPAELGVERIGHFGPFRPRFEESLWQPVADWLKERA